MFLNSELSKISEEEAKSIDPMPKKNPNLLNKLPSLEDYSES